MKTVVLLVAACLASCSSPNTITGSVTPRPDQDVTLVIHVVPAHTLVESGHRFGATGEPRAYSYRVENRGRLTCGIMFDDSVLEPTPTALAEFQWELYGNCLHHGADWRD